MTQMTASPWAPRLSAAFSRARQADILTTGITMAAITLLVGTGTIWLTSTLGLAADYARSHGAISTSLILNIALILFSWQRYRAMSQEVVSRRDGEQRAIELAQRDSLTGLLNRRAITHQGAAMINAARDAGQPIAVMIIDIDSFKSVNDLFGHVEGDSVIVEIARRLQQAMPAHSVLARIGGDEFLAIMPLTDAAAERIDAMGESLVATLSVPIVAAGVEVPISCSIGTMVTADLNQPLDAIIERADHAMYSAKRQGRCRYCRFDDAMADALNARAAIEAHLQYAIDNGEFSPVYEPLINLSTGATLGYEMLARWYSPVLGNVTPDTFIPLAEKAGLMPILTDQLLRTAMRDALDWPPHITLSVNISPIQLRDPWFAQKIVRLLVETRFPGARLIIEITETALVDNLAMARTTFESLRNQGVRIALDDFGTGYSSIARLRELPFDSVKIDRGFIARMGSDDTARSITQAVLQLSQSLGLPVVAEGVETADIASQLSLLNCEVGQGRFYGASLTGDQVRALHGPLADANATGQQSAAG